MKTDKVNQAITIIAVAGLALPILKTDLALAETVAQRQQQTYPPSQPETNQSYPNRGYGRGRHHHGGMRGRGHHNRYGGMYNVNTVETIRGTVVSTNAFTPGNGMSQGREILVETEEGTVPVHLGPSRYLEDRGFQVNSGEEIEVRGSRVNWAGNPVIMAAEIRQGDRVIELRNNDGVPAWNTNRNRNQPGTGCCGW